MYFFMLSFLSCEIFLLGCLWHKDGKVFFSIPKDSQELMMIADYTLLTAPKALILNLDSVIFDVNTVEHR